MKNLSFIILTVLALFTILPQSHAQTIEVYGDITNNTTWLADTVKITGNLTVMDDITLKINPGTYVEFQGYYMLTVNGTIIAEGTRDSMIVFTVDDTTGFSDPDTSLGGWHGFRFDNSLTGANTVMYDNDTSRISFCIIQFGKSVGPDDNWASGDRYGGAFNIRFFSRLVVSNCIIRNNSAFSGGAFYGQRASPLIKNNTISECWSYDGTLRFEDSNPVIEANIISNNTGRGICNTSGNPVVINNLICNNSASGSFQAGLGGGIFFMTCKPVVMNNTICNNTTAGKGGGMAFENSIPDIYNTIIWGNTAQQAGDEIHLESANLSPDFYHCMVKGGVNGFSGETFTGEYINSLDTGAVFSDPEFVDPSGGAGNAFDGLSADWNLSPTSPCLNKGESEQTAPWLPKTDLYQNKRIRYGDIDIGAIEYLRNAIEVTDPVNADTLWFADTIRVMNDLTVNNGATLSILAGTTVEFMGNYYLDIQGRLLAVGTSDDIIRFTITDTSYFSITDSLQGGWNGIRFDETPQTNDTSRVEYAIFEYCKNIGPGGSGALYVNSFPKLVVGNCLFRNNMAEYGGAIYCKNSGILIQNNVIINNKATNPGEGQTCGGAICLWESSSLVTNNFISNNQSDVFGGGIFIFNSYSIPVIVNNIICNNYAWTGGGLYCDGSGARLIHNTICNNEAGGSGGGIHINSNAEIINTVIWGNEYHSYPDQLYISSDLGITPEIINSNIQEGLNAIGGGIGGGIYLNNIDTLPGFIMPSKGAGILYNGQDADWSVSNLSACIDKGTANITDLPQFDFPGNPRINNTRPDIGAIENLGGKIAITLQPENYKKCEGEKITFKIMVQDTALYQWLKDGLPITGANEPDLVIDPVLPADEGFYKCVVSNAYGDVESSSGYLVVHETPVFLEEPKNMWVEPGRESVLKSYARGTNLSYSWHKNDVIIPGAVTPEFKISNTSYSDEGKYRCIIKNTCGSDSAEAVYLYIAPQLCMVTVDPSTGKNLIIWEKKSVAPISYFNLYRESNYAGIYDLLTTVPYHNLSAILDSASIPTSRAYLYKITAVDTAGNETDIDLCKVHKTIHLLVTINPETKATQLDWDRYVGFEYGTYLIYRSDTTYNFNEIAQMSSSSSTWADPDPGEGTKYYRIAALKPDTCYPTGTSSKKIGSGPYAHSMSNIGDNLMLGIKGFEQIKIEALKIHPNPFNTTTTLVFHNPEGDAYTLYMMDLSGKICHIVNHITTSEYVLEKGNLKEGFYFVELRGPQTYRGKIIIE